ncbi:MAG TPA: hypothetical protein VI168_18040, partial [Croceibacterium sp.]
MKSNRPILAGTCLLALGAVLGPPLAALVHAAAVAFAEHNPTGGSDRPAAAGTNARAAYLFQIYEPHRPPARPGMLRDVEPLPWSECGHQNLQSQLVPPAGSAGPAPQAGFPEQSAALGAALMLAAHH